MCADKPVIEDSYYIGSLGMGALKWSPPESCSTIHRYGLLYTHTMCSTSDTTVRSVNSSSETIFLHPSEVYCIQVRAEVNESCYSNYSTCAQVASLQQGM